MVRSLCKACPLASYWLQVTLRELFAAASEGSGRADSLGMLLDLAGFIGIGPLVQSLKPGFVPVCQWPARVS